MHLYEHKWSALCAPHSSYTMCNMCHWRSLLPMAYTLCVLWAAQSVYTVPYPHYAALRAFTLQTYIALSAIHRAQPMHFPTKRKYRQSERNLRKWRKLCLDLEAVMQIYWALWQIVRVTWLNFTKFRNSIYRNKYLLFKTYVPDRVLL